MYLSDDILINIFKYINTNLNTKLNTNLNTKLNISNLYNLSLSSKQFNKIVKPVLEPFRPKCKCVINFSPKHHCLLTVFSKMNTYCELHENKCQWIENKNENSKMCLLDNKYSYKFCHHHMIEYVKKKEDKRRLKWLQQNKELVFRKEISGYQEVRLSNGKIHKYDQMIPYYTIEIYDKNHLQYPRFASQLDFICNNEIYQYSYWKQFVNT